MTRQEILKVIEAAIQERDDVLGCAIIADGININFRGEYTWWRVELRDITADLAKAFGRGTR